MHLFYNYIDFVRYFEVIKMNAKSRRIRHHKKNNYNRMHFCNELIVRKKLNLKSKRQKQKIKITERYFRNELIKAYKPKFTNIWTKGN